MVNRKIVVFVACILLAGGMAVFLIVASHRSEELSLRRLELLSKLQLEKVVSEDVKQALVDFYHKLPSSSDQEMNSRFTEYATTELAVKGFCKKIDSDLSNTRARHYFGIYLLLPPSLEGRSITIIAFTDPTSYKGVLYRVVFVANGGSVHQVTIEDGIFSELCGDTCTLEPSFFYWDRHKFRQATMDLIKDLDE